MHIKNILVGSVVLSSLLFSGGDIVPVEPMVEVEEVTVTNEWSYTGSMYLWAAGMSGQTAHEGDFDTPFSDILDNLDMAFMGTLGAQKERWGVHADIIYLDVGSALDDNRFIDDLSLKSWIISPTVSYELINDEQFNLHALAGARYFYMKPILKLENGLAKETSGDVWDGIVGLKGSYDFNEKWFMPFQADIGTGDTDVTWQAFAGIGYKYENFDLIVGYRHLEWDFNDNQPGGKVFNDFNVDGPVFGAKFRF